MSVNAPPPNTPSKKGDAEIESIKRSLSTKWGIQLRARVPTDSPSKRNLNRAEDKIVALIQYLYFTKTPQEGALDYALEQFEKNAIQIISKWQFKPYAEPDVLPSLEASKSALKQDFLKKRSTLSEKTIIELTESLRDFLIKTGERVRNGENFPKRVKVEGQISNSCFRFD